MDAETGFYLEHLSDADLALLAEAGEERGPVAERVARLRSDPGRVAALVEAPPVFDSLFRGRGDPLLLVTPMMAFAVLLAGATRDLGRARFVREWVGRGRTIPVFDVDALREFLADPLRRLFLGELLASYTRVASGSVWRRTPRGWRRQRFSELDPLQLARLADAASGVERLLAYRRLGDLALFLSGVFPDHVAARPIVGARAERLLRLLSAGNLAVEEGIPAPPEPGIPAAGIGLLEELGRRAYRVVVQTAGTAGQGMIRALSEAADRFREARRVLNFLAVEYLFRARERWFPSPGS